MWKQKPPMFQEALPKASFFMANIPTKNEVIKFLKSPGNSALSVSSILKSFWNLPILSTTQKESDLYQAALEVFSPNQETRTNYTSMSGNLWFPRLGQAPIEISGSLLLIKDVGA